VCEPAFLKLGAYLFAGAADAAEAYAERQEAQQRRASFEFFAFAAHELRNPLSSAKIAWELIRQDGVLEPRRAALLSQSLVEVVALVDQVITQSRLASSPPSAVVHREALDLDALVRNVLAESAVDADAREISLEHRGTAGLRVDGDHRLLRSALTNLVRNAVKFTRERGTIVIEARAAEGRVLVDVADECGGLPAERTERIFEAFSQAGPDRSGFGLGLAITKQAVEAMGGTIQVKNRTGSGCTFRLDLPPAP
jgi:signal transduction histidine kinase